MHLLPDDTFAKPPTSVILSAQAKICRQAAPQEAPGQSALERWGLSPGGGGGGGEDTLVFSQNSGDSRKGAGV